MAYGYLTPIRARRSSRGAGSAWGGSSLFDLNRQMNRLFEDLLEQPSRQDVGAVTGETIAPPAIDMHQDDDSYEITAEVPGVSEEDLDLHIEDGVLTLSGEKRSERDDQERGYCERSYGRFQRSIALPSNADEENCSAEFRDGVVRITIPKAENRPRGRKIPLAGSDAGAEGGKSAKSAVFEQRENKQEKNEGKGKKERPKERP